MICNKCHIDRPLVDFPNNKKFRDGKEKTCKLCKYKRNAEWRKLNPGYRHKYYVENIETHKQQVKAYRKSHREHLNAIKRENYLEDSDRYRRYSRKYYWGKEKGSGKRFARYTRYNKKIIEELKPTYVKRLLSRRMGLNYNSIPDSLIELNKTTIQLTRILNERKPQWNQ